MSESLVSLIKNPIIEKLRNLFEKEGYKLTHENNRLSTNRSKNAEA